MAQTFDDSGDLEPTLEFKMKADWSDVDAEVAARKQSQGTFGGEGFPIVAPNRMLPAPMPVGWDSEYSWRSNYGKGFSSSFGSYHQEWMQYQQMRDSNRKAFEMDRTGWLSEAETKQINSTIWFHGSDATKDFDRFRRFSHFGTLKAAHDIEDQQVERREPIWTDAGPLIRGQRIYPVSMNIRKAARFEDSGENGSLDIAQDLFRNGVFTEQDYRSVISSPVEKGYISKGYGSPGYEQMLPKALRSIDSRLYSILQRKQIDALVYENQNEDAGSTSLLIPNPAVISMMYGKNPKRLSLGTQTQMGGEDGSGRPQFSGWTQVETSSDITHRPVPYQIIVPGVSAQPTQELLAAQQRLGGLLGGRIRSEFETNPLAIEQGIQASHIDQVFGRMQSTFQQYPQLQRMMSGRALDATFQDLPFVQDVQSGQTGLGVYYNQNLVNKITDSNFYNPIIGVSTRKQSGERAALMGAQHGFSRTPADIFVHEYAHHIFDRIHQDQPQISNRWWQMYKGLSVQQQDEGAGPYGSRSPEEFHSEAFLATTQTNRRHPQLPLPVRNFFNENYGQQQMGGGDSGGQMGGFEQSQIQMGGLDPFQLPEELQHRQSGAWQPQVEMGGFEFNLGGNLPRERKQPAARKPRVAKPKLEVEEELGAGLTDAEIGERITAARAAKRAEMEGLRALSQETAASASDLQETVSAKRAKRLSRKQKEAALESAADQLLSGAGAEDLTTSSIESDPGISTRGDEHTANRIAMMKSRWAALHSPGRPNWTWGLHSPRPTNLGTSSLLGQISTNNQWDYGLEQSQELLQTLHTDTMQMLMNNPALKSVYSPLHSLELVDRPSGNWKHALGVYYSPTKRVELTHTQLDRGPVDDQSFVLRHELGHHLHRTGAFAKLGLEQELETYYDSHIRAGTVRQFDALLGSSSGPFPEFLAETFALHTSSHSHYLPREVQEIYNRRLRSQQKTVQAGGPLAIAGMSFEEFHAARGITAPWLLDVLKSSAYSQMSIYSMIPHGSQVIGQGAESTVLQHPREPDYVYRVTREGGHRRVNHPAVLQPLWTFNPITLPDDPVRLEKMPYAEMRATPTDVTHLLNYAAATGLKVSDIASYVKRGETGPGTASGWDHAVSQIGYHEGVPKFVDSGYMSLQQPMFSLGAMHQMQSRNVLASPYSPKALPGTTFGQISDHSTPDSTTYAQTFAVGHQEFMFNAYRFGDSANWDLSFATMDANNEGSTGLTGKGNARKVMRAAMSAAQNFIDAKKPESFSFTALEPSRKSLYTRSLSMFTGYTGTTDDIALSDDRTFTFTKQQALMRQNYMGEDLGVPQNEEQPDYLEGDYSSSFTPTLLDSESDDGEGLMRHPSLYGLGRLRSRRSLRRNKARRQLGRSRRGRGTLITPQAEGEEELETVASGARRALPNYTERTRRGGTRYTSGQPVAEEMASGPPGGGSGGGSGGDGGAGGEGGGSDDFAEFQPVSGTGRRFVAGPRGVRVITEAEEEVGSWGREPVTLTPQNVDATDPDSFDRNFKRTWNRRGTLAENTNKPEDEMGAFYKRFLILEAIRAVSNTAYAYRQHSINTSLAMGDPDAMAQAEFQFQHQLADAVPFGIGHLAEFLRDPTGSLETSVSLPLAQAKIQRDQTQSLLNLQFQSQMLSGQAQAAGQVGVSRQMSEVELKYQERMQQNVSMHNERLTIIDQQNKASRAKELEDRSPLDKAADYMTDTLVGKIVEGALAPFILGPGRLASDYDERYHTGSNFQLPGQLDAARRGKTINDAVAKLEKEQQEAVIEWEQTQIYVGMQNDTHRINMQLQGSTGYEIRQQKLKDEQEQEHEHLRVFGTPARLEKLEEMQASQTAWSDYSMETEEKSKVATSQGVLRSSVLRMQRKTYAAQYEQMTQSGIARFWQAASEGRFEDLPHIDAETEQAQKELEWQTRRDVTTSSDEIGQQTAVREMQRLHQPLAAAIHAAQIPWNSAIAKLPLDSIFNPLRGTMQAARDEAVRDAKQEYRDSYYLRTQEGKLRESVTSELAQAYGPGASMHKWAARVLGIAGGAELKAEQSLLHDSTGVINLGNGGILNPINQMLNRLAKGPGMELADRERRIGINELKSLKADYLQSMHAEEGSLNRTNLANDQSGNPSDILKSIDKGIKDLTGKLGALVATD